MTIDKFKHYLGENLFSFISSLTLSQLIKMKAALLEDINTISHTGDVLFKRTIELQYINYLINE